MLCGFKCIQYCDICYFDFNILMNNILWFSKFFIVYVVILQAKAQKVVGLWRLSIQVGETIDPIDARIKKYLHVVPDWTKLRPCNGHAVNNVSGKVECKNWIPNMCFWGSEPLTLKKIDQVAVVRVMSHKFVNRSYPMCTRIGTNMTWQKTQLNESSTMSYIYGKYSFCEF